jgi:hypothetical protein
MSKNSYNWLTNAGMLLGILSAWLYQRAEVSHVFAVALAVVAAILSIGTYFYERFFPKSAEKVEVLIAPAVVTANESGGGVVREIKAAPGVKLVAYREQEIMLAEFRAATQRTLVDRIRDLASMIEAQRNTEMERTTAYMQRYVQHNNAGRRLRYRFPTDNRLMEPEVEMSAREAAVCYRQIMRDIVDSNDDTEWDFTVGPKGLRVSGKKHHPRPVPSAQMEKNMHILEQEAGHEDARERLA